MKGEKKKIKTVAYGDINSAAFNKKRFATLVRMREEAAANEKQAKASKEECDKGLRAMLIKAKIKHRVGIDEMAVMVAKGKNRYLDPVLLLESNVSAAVIEKCYKETEYAYISAVKWQEESDEESEGE